KQCNKPEFSTSLCSDSDPCGFECKPPYTKVGDKCECKAPYMLCNGQCTLPPGGVSQWYCIFERPYSDVCGVYGGEEYAYECVNTKTNLESCGGCLIPNPFRPHTASSATGVDCAAIDHADSVSCASGRCIVESCENGWEVDSARSSCKEANVSKPDASSNSVFSVLSDLLNVKRDEEN
ncbi:hypothetical protein BC629DRAFT_1290184, partial [Irpex lacteus]